MIFFSILIGNLQAERSTIEETHIEEVTTVKTLYNKELDQLRNAVDAISREKARLEIEADKNGREAKEAKMTLIQNEKRLAAAERDLTNKNQRLLEVESQLNALDGEVRLLRPDNAKMSKQLADAKRNLEDETLKRTDLQNQLQTKEESLKFENSMLEQQLNETRVKKQMEISEIDSRLSDAYEQKLQQSLNVSIAIRFNPSHTSCNCSYNKMPTGTKMHVGPVKFVTEHSCSNIVLEDCSGMIGLKTRYQFHLGIFLQICYFKYKNINPLICE